MANVNVVYVGKKPFARDNVAGSNKTWAGAGDVQEVTDQQARVLIKYPDQWALEHKLDAAVVNAPVLVTVSNEAGQETKIDTVAFAKPIESMTKDELVAYAKEVLKKELKPGTTRKLMLDQVEEWQKERGLVA